MPSTSTFTKSFGTLESAKSHAAHVIRHYICPWCCSRVNASYKSSFDISRPQHRPLTRVSTSSAPPTISKSSTGNVLPSLVLRHHGNPYLLRRRVTTMAHAQLGPSSWKRRASSMIAPVTSVNARKSVPKTLQELHGRLRDLEKKAGSFVDLSLLKLAARGLESENPVVRIAGMSLTTS